MDLIDGTYKIQGLDIAHICKEFGTPLYVYDAEKIANQVDHLRKAFSGVDIKIKYAVKALTNISVLKVIRQHGAGVDVVSIQEGHIALRAGFSPQEIMFTPNFAEFSEIDEAVELGLIINIDNLSYLKKFGEKYGGKVSCCIRMNPHIMAGGNYKISTGHQNSKFGISIYQLQQAMEVVDKYNIQVDGLHIHTGSEISDTEVFLKMADILLGVAREFKDLKFIDFGSGFKVAYTAGDMATDVDDVGEKLGKFFNEFCEKYGRKLEMWIEPGKYIVSESGTLFATVTAVKETPSLNFVGLNTGLNHLIRPMMYDAYHEIVNASNPTGEEKLYTVVGYICETDTIGSDRRLNEVREGDIMAIKNAGAYAFSMASNYNSRLRPAEVLVINGKAKLIRERETLDDLIRNQKVIDV